MPANIKLRELRVHDPVKIRFGFSGLNEKHAQSIMRDIVRDGWPRQRRPKQSVYVIRLVGDVAIAYKQRFSPVTYIGQGNAFSRLYNHTNWLVPLLINVPQLSVEILITEISRKNHATLYRHIEADLLRWFSKTHGAVPWFNRRWEPSKEDKYAYEPDAKQALRKLIGVGAGTNYKWAIQPTKNNEQFEPYDKGLEK